MRDGSNYFSSLCTVGLPLGFTIELALGLTVGLPLGFTVGLPLGLTVELPLGFTVGLGAFIHNF